MLASEQVVLFPRVARRGYSVFFFLKHPSTSGSYSLSLHDALPISFGQAVASFKKNPPQAVFVADSAERDRKSTRLNSSHPSRSYAVFCLKKKRSRCTCTSVGCSLPKITDRPVSSTPFEPMCRTAG